MAEADLETARRLCSSCRLGDVNSLRRLLTNSNANVRIDGWSPLMEAAAASKNSGLDCLVCLLLAGADAAFADDGGFTACHVAARNNNFEIVAELHRRCPFLLDRRSLEGDTPLMVAATVDSSDCVQLLLQLGADLSIVNMAGKTALSIAKFCNSKRSRAIIEAANARPLNPASHDSKQLLRRLCSSARCGDIQELQRLAGRVGLNARWRQATPLMHAAADSLGRGFACADWLLREGADVRVVNDFGRSAAHVAAVSNNWRILWRLAECGLDLDEVDDGGDTPLMLAVERNNREAAEVIIGLGADLGVRDCQGRSVADRAEENKAWSCLLLIKMALQNRDAVTAVSRTSVKKKFCDKSQASSVSSDK